MIPVENLRPVAEEMLSGLKAGDNIRQRALFHSSMMERLPTATGEMLKGVRADGALRHRILMATKRRGSVQRKSAPAQTALRLAPMLSMGLVLVMMVTLGTWYADPSRSNQGGNVQASQNTLNSHAAGDLITGALTLEGGVPQYRSLFGYVDSGEPALISVNGRYYQLLNSPLALSEDMLNTRLGDIQQSDVDISLADRVGVLSNVVNAGEAVYSVRGYSTKTMLAASVGGSMRLFQRVGYATKGLVGSDETFADTLAIEGEVLALELSGVGIISDPAESNALIELLLEEAALWYGEAIPVGEQALTIYLGNNLSLQLHVSGDILSGCGEWSCPSFFEAFAEALAK